MVKPTSFIFSYQTKIGGPGYSDHVLISPVECITQIILVIFSLDATRIPKEVCGRNKIYFSITIKNLPLSIMLWLHAYILVLNTLVKLLNS